MKADRFQEKVMRLLKIWNDWALYDIHYMFGLEAIFNCEGNKFIEVNGCIRLNYEEKN